MKLPTETAEIKIQTVAPDATSALRLAAKRLELRHRMQPRMAATVAELAGLGGGDAR